MSALGYVDGLLKKKRVADLTEDQLQILEFEISCVRTKRARQTKIDRVIKRIQDLGYAATISEYPDLPPEIKCFNWTFNVDISPSGAVTFNPESKSQPEWVRVLKFDPSAHGFRLDKWDLHCVDRKDYPVSVRIYYPPVLDTDVAGIVFNVLCESSSVWKCTMDANFNFHDVDANGMEVHFDDDVFIYVPK